VLAAFIRPLPAGRNARIPSWLVNASATVTIGVLVGFAFSQWLAPAAGIGPVSKLERNRAAPPPMTAENVAEAAAPVLLAEAGGAHADASVPLMLAAVQAPRPAYEIPVSELGVFPPATAQTQERAALATTVSTAVVAPLVPAPEERAESAPKAPERSSQRGDATGVRPQPPAQASAEPAGAVAHAPSARHEPLPATADLPRPAAVPASKPPSADAGEKRAVLEVRTSSVQRMENAYRGAVNLLGQGRHDEARAALAKILVEQPAHDGARQTLIGLLVQGKAPAEAEALADERLARGADHPGFAMISARLKLERGDLAAALDVLQRSAPHAQGNADYLAFKAAVEQRLGRHGDAAEDYRAALARNPGSGVWLMGLGISLQALGRSAEAQESFRRAREASGLTPELRAYIDQRIAQLDR